jgi:hypothetical protein
MFDLRLTLTLTLLVACSAEKSDTVTDGTSTGDSTTASIGTTAPGTDTSTSVDPTTGVSSSTTTGTTTEADTTPSTTTEVLPSTTTEDEPWPGTDSDSDSEDECASTCGISIDCPHPDVDESLEAEPCAPGFHCENASACGCPVTWCKENCDPENPFECSNGWVCDPDLGVCVEEMP